MSKQQIHISDVIQFLQCRRAWNWSSKLRNHLTTKKPYEPFYFGKVMHKFLEYHYKKHQLNIDAFGDIAARIWLENQPDHIPEFIEFGAQLFEHYQTWQASDQSQWCDNNVACWLGLEQDFTVPVLTPVGKASSKFVFSGTVDGIFRSRVDGRLYLHEIKTTSSIDRRIPQLQFELQPTAYMWAVEQIYQEQIAGVVYTLIRKKIPADPDVRNDGTLSRNKAIDTTAEHYRECIKRQHPSWNNLQIKSVYGDILQTLLDEPNRFFRRVLITRTRSELDQFGAMLYSVARDMTRRSTPLYHNPGYFCGNCLFQQPCLLQSRGDSPAAYLAEHYTRNTRLDR